MKRHLLDTNVLSQLVRQPQGEVAHKIAEIGEAAVCTSVIVACELRYGAAKKASPRLSAQIEAILGAIEILPFDVPADAAYADLRIALEQAGTPIGPNDMLIAADALAHDCVLVTANVREFSPVPGLSVVSWP